MQQVDRQVRPKLSKLQSDQSGSDSVPGTPASENFSIAPTIRNVEALNEKTRWSGSIPSTRDINQQALPQPKVSNSWMTINPCSKDNVDNVFGLHSVAGTFRGTRG